MYKRIYMIKTKEA